MDFLKVTILIGKKKKRKLKMRFIDIAKVIDWGLESGSGYSGDVSILLHGDSESIDIEENYDYVLKCIKNRIGELEIKEVLGNRSIEETLEVVRLADVIGMSVVSI